MRIKRPKSPEPGNSMDQMRGSERAFIEPGKETGRFDKFALVPGNCLFSSLTLKPNERTLFFMAEDSGLLLAMILINTS